LGNIGASAFEASIIVFVVTLIFMFTVSLPEHGAGRALAIGGLTLLITIMIFLLVVSIYSFFLAARRDKTKQTAMTSGPAKTNTYTPSAKDSSGTLDSSSGDYVAWMLLLLGVVTAYTWSRRNR
jgi:hypothetical protein